MAEQGQRNTAKCTKLLGININRNWLEVIIIPVLKRHGLQVLKKHLLSSEFGTLPKFGGIVRLINVIDID